MASCNCCKFLNCFGNTQSKLNIILDFYDNEIIKSIYSHSFFFVLISNAWNEFWMNSLTDDS